MSTGSILNKSDANLANAWFYSGSNNLGIINPTLGADYKNLLGVDPGLYSADSFDSAMFLLDGIKAGSTTRSALNTYISTRTFQGLAGPVSFDANGELEKRKSSKVVLSSGVLSVANGATVGINGNLSSTAKSVPVPNFQFKVTEWDLSATASKTYFHFPGYNSVVESKSSVINTFLPNGTTKFEIESMSDSQGPNMRKTYYEATVSAGVLTQLSDISNPAAPVTITKTGDTYVLKYKSFNFVATISGDTDFSGSLGIIFEKGSPDKGIAKVVVDSGNKLSAVLDPTKNYRIDFYPAGANSKFDLTTWDNISFLSLIHISEPTRPY